MKNLIKRWPVLAITYGLALIIDNWGQNHDALILPGGIMFGLGLEYFIEMKIKEKKDGTLDANGEGE